MNSAKAAMVLLGLLALAGSARAGRVAVVASAAGERQFPTDSSECSHAALDGWEQLIVQPLNASPPRAAATACSLDSECSPEEFCDVDAGCSPKLKDMRMCERDGQCVSGACR
jgi:hypothetical protein